MGSRGEFLICLKVKILVSAFLLYLCWKLKCLQLLPRMTSTFIILIIQSGQVSLKLSWVQLIHLYMDNELLVPVYPVGADAVQSSCNTGYKQQGMVYSQLRSNICRVSIQIFECLEQYYSLPCVQSAERNQVQRGPRGHLIGPKMDAGWKDKLVHYRNLPFVSPFWLWHLIICDKCTKSISFLLSVA